VIVRPDVWVEPGGPAHLAQLAQLAHRGQRRERVIDGRQRDACGARLHGGVHLLGGEVALGIVEKSDDRLALPRQVPPMGAKPS
jgi:hypothetical protein